MKKLVVFTKKEWKQFKANVAADTRKLMEEERQRGYAYANKEMEALVAALATRLQASSADTASIDVDQELIGSHAFGVLRSGMQLTVHIYPKSLLPEA